MADQAAEYREKLLDAVVETDEALMERYLDGQELAAEEVANALKDAVTRGEVFPSRAASRRRTSAHALLDLLVEGVRRRRRRARRSRSRAADRRLCVQDDRRPLRRPINVFRVL